ncbi:MAG: hypothetical protein ACM3XM_05715 [Mycobacterium leprae]
MKHRSAILVGLLVVASAFAAVHAGAKPPIQRVPALVADCNPTDLPAEKADLVKAKCAASAPTGDPVLNPAIAMHDETPKPSMGIDDLGVQGQPWANGRFTISNAWFGKDIMVFAASLYEAPDKGAIILVSRTATPQILGTFTTESGGMLRITSATGNVLGLVAKDGTSYLFDIDKQVLSRR